MANALRAGTERAILIVGHGSRDDAGANEFRAFVATLAPRWPDRVVRGCFLELADPPVIPALEELIATGVRDITVAPCFLFSAGHIKNDVPTAIGVARARHPDVRIRYAASFGIEPRLLDVLDERLAEGALAPDVPPAETAVLLVGRGSTDPDANADLFKLARLFWEGRSFGWVEAAFVSLAPPDVPTGIRRCLALGARQVVVAPVFLFTGVLVRRIAAQAAAVAAERPAARVVVLPHLGGHPLLADLLVQRVDEAEEGRVLVNCDCCLYRVPLRGFEQRYAQAQGSDAAHGLRGVALQHGHAHQHGRSAEHGGPMPTTGAGCAQAAGGQGHGHVHDTHDYAPSAAGPAGHAFVGHDHGHHHHEPPALVTPAPGTLLQRYGLPPDEIERLSLARLERRLGDRLRVPPEARGVALRMLYAAGDASLAEMLRISDGAVAAGLRALAAGAPLVADVKMVAVALDRRRAQQLGAPILCAIDEPRVLREAHEAGLPRAAVAMRRLARRAPGGIYVIGNAPTALLQLLDLVDTGAAWPALVVATPLGFVSAAEAKDELAARAIPFVTVLGTRGGSAVAAAAANALLRLATSGLAADELPGALPSARAE